MRMAFVTGIKFFEYQNEYYSTTFSREVIAARYLSVFEDLNVFASIYPGDARTPDSMVQSSGNGVKFVFQKSFKRKLDFLFKRAAIKTELGDFLSQMDGAIIRLPSTLGLIACEVCKTLHRPYLVEAVGCPWESLWNHSWPGKLLAPTTFLRTRRCIGNASHVVYTSREFLQKRYPTKGQHTHCSNVALSEFDDSILKRRHERAVDKAGATVIGSCGQIDIVFKGHGLVVEAISLLNKEGYDFRYELVGGGNPDYIMGVARKLGVADRITVLGMKRREDVLRWLDTLDIYAQPSMTEGLPRALVEAMSRAVPCFGAATGGIPELLSARCLFANRSVKSLMETLKAVDAHRLEISEEVYQRSKEYDAVRVESRRASMLKEFKEWMGAGE